jgi:hypothetical protein
LFHRGVRCGHVAFRLRTARCSHGLWIDTLPGCCRAFRAAQTFRCWTFRLAVPNPLRRPRPDSRGRQGVSALSGSCDGARRRPEGRRLASDGRFRPEGRCVPCRSSHPKEERVPSRSAPMRFPKEASRPHPTLGPEGTVGCQ